MHWKCGVWSSIAAIAVSCAATAAAYYCRTRKADVNEVMVFCKLQYNVCNYFERLIGYVESAKRNVSICMPGIQNIAIQGRLVELIKKKKIQARIIIDKSGYNEWSAPFLEELKEAGAEIKLTCSEFSMSHRFCLIDHDILMTGTLNWGDDLSADDWNYVLITSKTNLVQPVDTEFQRLWDTCESLILCKYTLL